MFKVSDVDVKGFKQFDNLLGSLGEDAPKVINRALNRTGDMAKTRVVRELTKQTGLPRKTILKALKVRRSSWKDLEYTIKASGGDVSLKYFKARETRRGVTAFVRGERELFEHTFIKGGSFARGRVDINMGGHVFERIGGRNEIEKIKSGVFIPIEMVEGATAQSFEDLVADVLPRRINHEINRAIGL